MRIGNIVLQSTPLPTPDKSLLAKAISDAIAKEGFHLLDWNKDIEQWQNRILSLKKWNPQDLWPDVSTHTLLLTNSEWLTPYLNDIKKPEDLKKIYLKEILQYSLDQTLQQQLDKLAPPKIKVPSGSFIELEYQANGDVPVLPVRLQECFGMLTTPTVNNGSINVLMHLLSPAFRIVQITTDLQSFWNTGYFDVRKDLRSKYKKHYWPENPLEVEAIKGSKKRP